MYAPVYTHIYLDVLVPCRYLGLFGDHIVQAVLYRYTQVLSTVFARRGRAQHAGVLTVSWPMDIVESAITAGWQR